MDNFSDSYGKRHGNENYMAWEPWLDDGHTATAEVGSYDPNPFGLHDVHGNLMEWCRDWFIPYGSEVRAGDGERVGGHANRVLRGGCFQSLVNLGRSASREDVNPGDAAPSLGVRPARAVSGR